MSIKIHKIHPKLKQFLRYPIHSSKDQLKSNAIIITSSSKNFENHHFFASS